MKVGFLITARLKSTRLPRKILLEVGGKPFLSQMIHRIRKARRIDEIVICTSTNPQDDPLEELALAEGVACFRGHEEDVIRRLSEACAAKNLDYALNITADCPLVDPGYADRIVEEYQRTGADLIRSFGLPHGAFSYGLKPAALRKVVEIKDDERTEVWGRYFTDTDLFDVWDLSIGEKHRWADLRMTLDYPEDYQFFEALWSGMTTPPQDASLDEILEFLRSHPEIVAINAECADRFSRRFQRQSAIRLRPRHDVRRALIIGAGSIGQRHIRNILGLGIEEIAAIRTRRGHSKALPKDLRVEEIESWGDARDWGPDVATVSNPTSLHVESVSKLLPFVRGIFIEKPLSGSLDGVTELLDGVARNRTITFMGYNLRFHPLVEAIAGALRGGDLGRLMSLQVTVGHWLPDWHPYEDHCLSYAARRDLGGGAVLTLIHEVDLILSWAGEVERVAAVFPEDDSLPLDVDVQANLMIAHAGGAVSQVHLDFLQKRYHREGIISCERGYVRYDLAAGRAEVYGVDSKAPRVIWNDPGYDVNGAYREMMKAFLRCVREGRVHHEMDIWHGAESLSVVETGRKSAATGCWVSPDHFIGGWK